MFKRLLQVMVIAVVAPGLLEASDSRRRDYDSDDSAERPFRGRGSSLSDSQDRVNRHDLGDGRLSPASSIGSGASVRDGSRSPSVGLRTQRDGRDSAERGWSPAFSIGSGASAGRRSRSPSVGLGTQREGRDSSEGGRSPDYPPRDELMSPYYERRGASDDGASARRESRTPSPRGSLGREGSPCSQGAMTPVSSGRTSPQHPGSRSGLSYNEFLDAVAADYDSESDSVFYPKGKSSRSSPSYQQILDAVAANYNSESDSDPDYYPKGKKGALVGRCHKIAGCHLVGLCMNLAMLSGCHDAYQAFGDPSPQGNAVSFGPGKEVALVVTMLAASYRSWLHSRGLSASVFGGSTGGSLEDDIALASGVFPSFGSWAAAVLPLAYVLGDSDREEPLLVGKVVNAFWLAVLSIALI